jgi:hypothetical protein
LKTKLETIRVIASQRVEAEASWLAPEQAANDQALDQAVRKADENARKTAQALGLRLLGVASLNKNILKDEGSQMLEARVEAEYFVSGFHQSKLDLKLLATSGNLLHLLKKEFSTRWFQLQMQFRSSSPIAVAGKSSSRRALVAGHFSLPGGGGTFGDVEAQEMVCEWLSEAGIEYDLASNQEDGVRGPNLLDLNSAEYGIFIFVCGPWYPQKKIPSILLKRFAHCLKIGINLTTSEVGKAGFDYLLARDSLQENRADLAFAKKQAYLPVVGVLLVERQAAYGSRQRHLYVKKIFDEYLATGQVVPIWLDTVINHNHVGLKSGREFESLLRKVDVLITNRLHGLVLGLKNSIPVVAVDSIAGGGKVTAQAKALGWSVLIPVEELSVEKLSETVQICLGDMSPELKKIHQQGRASIAKTRGELLQILESLTPKAL